MKRENQFHPFETERQKYIYDCYSRNVFKVSEVVYTKILNSDFSQECLCEYDERVFNFLLSIPKPRILPFKQTRCCISINFSNTCNMACKYCFRMHNDDSQLTKQDLRDIVDFAVNRFMPDATEYPFSAAFSSEPFMTFELLQELDDIIADYEGYLLSEEDFLKISEKDLWQKVPVELQKKYSLLLKSENYLYLINLILKNENLTLYWGTPKDKYALGILNYTKTLSHSKAAFVNRTIICEKFLGKIKKADVKKYFSLYFMSNGTLITQKYVDFIKSLYMKVFTISIDGFEEIHNYNRPYLNGLPTFLDTVKGIHLLQKNGIIVNVNSVITPNYMNLLEIINFLRSLNVSAFSFNPARSVEYGFNTDSMSVLLNELQNVYDAIKRSVTDDDYSLVYFLRLSKIFDAIKNIVSGGLVPKRCQWGERVSINSHGDLHYCDYTSELEPKIGNFRDDITFSDVKDNKSVDDNEKCCECWAKYLCGGTCYYLTLITGREIDEAECMFRKGLIEMSLDLYAWLIENDKLNPLLKIIYKP